MADLADWFKRMSTASSQALSDMYRDSRLNNSSEKLGQLNALLASGESAPVNWQNYLRNGIVQLKKDMEKTSRPDFAVKGFPTDLEGEQLIRFWKDVWAGFAAALNAWPEIRQAAADILATKKATD